MKLFNVRGTERMMCEIKNLREYLLEKDEELERNIDVDAILDVPSFAQIFDEDELLAIRHEPDVTKTKIFLQKLHVKGDDNALNIFIDAIRLIQPDLSLLSELDETGCLSPATSESNQTPAPTECDSGSTFDDCPMSSTYPSSLPGSIQDPAVTSSTCTDCCSDKSRSYSSSESPDCTESVGHVIIKQIFAGLGELSDLHDQTKEELQNHLNNMVNECKMTADQRDNYEYWYKKLAECMMDMCSHGFLSYQRVIDALRYLGHEKLAEQFEALMNSHVKEQHYSELPGSIKLTLTQVLSGEPDVWPLLPEWLGVKDIQVGYLRQQNTNPAEYILDRWARRRSATVNQLYLVLMAKGHEMAASIIETQRFISTSKSVNYCLI